MKKIVIINCNIKNILIVLKFLLIFSFPKYKLLNVIPLPVLDHENIFMSMEVNNSLIVVKIKRYICAIFLRTEL